MSEHRFEVHQEEDTVQSRTLTRVGVGAVVISVLAVVVSSLLLGRDGQAKLGGGPAERVEQHGDVAPPTLGLIEQTLIEHEERGLAQRRSEEERLHTYGWVDRAHGVARIPIQRAMAMIVDANRADAGGAGDAR
jgi:hypothetical protein